MPQEFPAKFLNKQFDQIQLFQPYPLKRMSSKELSGSCQKPQSGSLVRSLFSIIKLGIITAIFLIGIVPLIYHHGGDRQHEIDEHPLYQIFEEPTYRLIYKQLDKRKSNRVILHGSFGTGIKHFVEHYANKKTQKGKHVVFSQVEPEDDMSIKPYAQEAKNILEETLDIEPNVPTLWIVLSENQFPTKEVDLLVAKNPKDRIIVVTSAKDSAHQSFKTITYPGMDSDDFKSHMVEGLKVDADEVDVIYEYFGSSEAIFNMIDEKEDALTKENLLGENWKSMELMTQTDKQILQQLCRTGTGASTKSSKPLDAFGCIFHGKKYYWDHDVARLNYELLQNEVCPQNGVMSEDARKRMEDEIMQQKEQRLKKKREAQEKEKQERQERQERQAEKQKKEKERLQKQKEKLQKQTDKQRKQKERQQKQKQNAAKDAQKGKEKAEVSGGGGKKKKAAKK